MVIAKLDDVSFNYGDRIILRNLKLDIVQGAITCLVGLSGAGKSTILRLINGLRKPSSGHVYVKGIDVCHMPDRELTEFRRSIGFSFQFAALFDSLSIYDNVALPLRESHRFTSRQIDERVSAVLDAVGLSTSKSKLPSELSGGMLKRAGFARAVVTNPDLVLYDEPTTGLDPIITHVLTDTIKRLRASLHGTAVVISHDLASIFMMADYIAMIFEGAIIAYGTAEEFRNSPNPIVQQFLQGSDVGPIPL